MPKPYTEKIAEIDAQLRQLDAEARHLDAPQARAVTALRASLLRSRRWYTSRLAARNSAQALQVGLADPVHLQDSAH